MIEVRIKGPNKQNILDFLRRKSKAEKDNIQMLRLNQDYPGSIEIKKFSMINLPSVTNKIRKNDIPRHVPFSLVNKVLQKNDFTETQANDLSKKSIQLGLRQPKQKRILQRKAKSHLQLIRPLHRSEEMMKNIPHQKKSSKQKMMNILSENVKKHLSIDFKNKSHSIQKISKSLLFYLSCQQQKSKSFELPKQQEYLKKLCISQIIESPNKKNNIKDVQIYLEHRIPPRFHEVQRIKTEGNEKLKSYILKKIRTKQTQSHMKMKKQISFKDDRSKQQFFDECSEFDCPFQKSFGPWRNSGFSTKNQHDSQNALNE